MAGPVARSAYLGWLWRAWARGGTATPSKGDAVLGLATGYDAHDIAPFVRSLRAVFDGHIALGADDRPDVRALFAQHDVEMLPLPPAEGWAPHPVMARFAAFDRWLSARPGIGSVLITDVRDVVFQGPPFDPAPTGLEVFVEADRLGDHGFNMKYLRAVAGDAAAEALADRPSICVGTVMGPAAEVVRFCRLALMLAAVPRSEMGGAFGADQAACNLAVHQGLIAATITPNHRRVATVGLSDPATLGLDAADRILNPDGSISPILHQHDRHPALAEAVRRRWGQGLEVRERVTPKTAGRRWNALKQSVRRRLPEPR